MPDIRLLLPINDFSISDKSSERDTSRKPNLPNFQIQLRDLPIDHTWIGLDEAKSSFVRASMDWSLL